MLGFSVLGPVEIGDDGRTARPGGTMQQTLLATLLVCGGTVVTVDALIEEQWANTPPARAENALQAQVSRLRRSLAQLEPDATGSRLGTCTSGYTLRVDRTELDAWRFQHTVETISARSERGRAGDLRSDIAELRRGLDLWRGPVFGGLTGGPLCQRAAREYNESRNVALSLLYDLELRCGRHATVLPELTTVFAQRPLNEQFCALLMTALYRSGRQTESLNVYRQFRQRLADDLGIEPSPVLRQCEAAILNHDPVILKGSSRVGHRPVYEVHCPETRERPRPIPAMHADAVATPGRW